jgi:hypothetical protein
MKFLGIILIALNASIIGEASGSIHNDENAESQSTKHVESPPFESEATISDLISIVSLLADRIEYFEKLGETTNKPSSIWRTWFCT